jgi:hypothetical protein
MPKISLSGPADLLSVIPFHLGFHPRRSVVVVCLHHKTIGLVARFDLPPDSLVDASVQAHLATLVRDPPSSVWLVGFEDEDGESEPLSRALLTALRGQQVDVEDRLVVRHGRWFVPDCDCCPTEGRPLPEAADVPAVAGYVALGHTVLADRDALAALVAPLPADHPDHDEAVAAVDRWQARYTVCTAFDRLRSRGLLIDGLMGSDDLDDLGGYDDAGSDVDDGSECEDGSESDDDDASRSGPAAGVSAVLDLAAARARHDAGSGSPEGSHPSTALARLQAESLLAWGEVLRGEVAGDGLRSALPALLGPLRDLDLRDAILAWLCPGSLPLTEVPPSLVTLLETCVGVEVHTAAAGRGVPSGPVSRPARGGPTGGRRRERGAADAAGSTSSGWREWEEAGAPHLLQARLEGVCRIAPASHAAPLLAMTGNVAWWHGDGARAGVALDTCLELEPDHRLATLIRSALDLGLRGGGGGHGRRGGEDAGAADGAPPGESGCWNRPSSA